MTSLRRYIIGEVSTGYTTDEDKHSLYLENGKYQGNAFTKGPYSPQGGRGIRQDDFDSVS